MDDDPLDDVFNLETRFYSDGYNLGLKDGAQAGRIEGRTFGMEKGFQKFFESGRLAGKAVVWANRLPRKKPDSKSSESSVAAAAAAATASSEEGSTSATTQTTEPCALPPLPNNARLERNVQMLYALVEPDTLSTENTDDAVQDFDDRLKRAQGKAKIIERMLG